MAVFPQEAYGMFDNLTSLFCRRCLDLKGGNFSVEDILIGLGHSVEKGDLVDVYTLILGALQTLQQQGGCNSCIDVLGKLKKFMEEAIHS